MMSVIPGPEDLYLFHEGNLFRSYRVLGAHFTEHEGTLGVRFSVWAPHAREVRVIGDFNYWNGSEHVLSKISVWGVWSLFVPNVREGEYYKYEIVTSHGTLVWKADPYAFHSELKPGTASRVCSLEGYEWHDDAWQEAKRRQLPYDRPMNIYEVHMGTWKKKPGDGYYTYRELADELVDYVAHMGYTHIELMPLAEHPFDRSWGYQATGYYSVTSRFGTPKDFMYFVDRCHQQGIGVIMDWVPGHFVKDDHGLRHFDGQPLYEHSDPLRAEKPEWGTMAFDFSKPEVVSFLISNALFWMDMFHIDGLRVDAVASLLYLNFGKPREQWIKNEQGGEDNPEAIAFLKKLNQTVFAHYPDALMMAEDSSDWPLVTAPVHDGGLGFNYKWNMGWMNDMLRYMECDPYFRKGRHNLLTFSFMYTYSENYVLPLSHDEVVHGKKSLLNKMPGDYWQKFANLRVLYGYMMGHPGKKLLFMGGEFGQFDEWKDLEDLDWEMLGYDSHRGMHQYVHDLNHLYLQEKALWELDHSPEGFSWIDPHDHNQSIVTFTRQSSDPNDFLIIVCNFTPVTHARYRIGVPFAGEYTERFNSDTPVYGGSGQLNTGRLKTENVSWHFQPCSLHITIPPLATVVLKPVKIGRKEAAGKRERG
ncbi:1,4-alpha-glucan branching protein GlgB [Paenibacillus doosanensis]|uniref:1,4-alpha-glucan branching enzyme GlgB n=1 Tax=Paenibacillus konkukensis TaxID=2020716 RepID=A0ABY4RK52_9BACL|nr:MULTISPECIES: 1,4-alpha-glucan branching protein GlgB [Paenibacillus]MCS7459730.1 1,4-alpha-glucan branching protein GlgB [Paenibacillus doosanensis]UQZ81854.1 1,4-alpha-glucan branching enzyme GlgB [Paenibacillus konkukensis]